LTQSGGVNIDCSPREMSLEGQEKQRKDKLGVIKKGEKVRPEKKKQSEESCRNNLGRILSKIRLEMNGNKGPSALRRTRAWGENIPPFSYSPLCRGLITGATFGKAKESVPRACYSKPHSENVQKTLREQLKAGKKKIAPTWRLGN